MYGWLCGIIFSKLALSASLVAASVPSTSVSSAQTTTTESLWLNIVRSSRLPDLQSKSARPRTTGIVSGLAESAVMMIVLARPSARRDPGDHDAARAGECKTCRSDVDKARERHRLPEHHLLERASAIGAARDATARVGNERGALPRANRRDDRGGKPGVDLGPRGAVIVAAVHVAAKPVGDHRGARIGDAEEAAVVRHGERGETSLRGIELQHQSALAGHVELSGRRSNRVEVEEFGIVD